MRRLPFLIACAVSLAACTGSTPPPAPASAPAGGSPAAVADPLAAPGGREDAAPVDGGGQRPMDEVPVQAQLPNGDREYGFANGCKVVLEAKRAVVKTAGAACASHHRDIALLYAAAD